MSKVGVLILPPLNNESIPYIKKYTAGHQVISNVPLGVPHTVMKFTTDTKKRVYGDNAIYVTTDDYDLEDQQRLQFAYLLEMLKLVDKMVIVSPTKIPIIFALVATQQLHDAKNVRVIVKGKEYTPKDVISAISQTPKELLDTQWEHLTQQESSTVKKPMASSKQYADEELIRTPNGCVLRQYQQQIVDFALETKRAGLFVDMGLGKTLATLATLNELSNTGKIDTTKPVLIVAPIMVALDTWSREAEKWGYDMGILINIKLKKAKREALYDKLLEPQSKLTLVTTNPAQLASMVEYFASRRVQPPFQVAIVDELSQFKSPSAKRFDQLRQLTRRCEYFFGLTGTPAPNNLLDIWSQLMVIDEKNGKNLGYNFFEYRSLYFEPDVIGRDGTVYKWKLKRNAAETIYDMIRPTTISMRSEGLIELPDIVFSNQYVTLPPKARKIYQEMDTKLRKQLADSEKDASGNESDGPATLTLSEGGTDIEIANSAVLASKLVQLSSGAIYDNFLDLTATNTRVSHYEVIHDEKLKLLKDIVENATSPILVFFMLQSELERMREYIEFEHLHPKRDDVQDLIARWNRGEVPVMVAHPASVGHGLNLQDGGHTMIWMSIPWSNEQYRQSVKRLYRSGQTDTVSVIHIVAENTNDIKDIERLETKEDGQSALMEALER